MTDLREFYEERAAILEYEANMSREEAEAEARRLTLEYRDRGNGQHKGHAQWPQ